MGAAGLIFQTVQCADFVAGRGAQIGEIQLHTGPLAHTGRVFAGGTAIGKTRRVPLVAMLGALRRKTDSTAIAAGRRLAIDGFAECKVPGAGEVEVSAFWSMTPGLQPRTPRTES